MQFKSRPEARDWCNAHYPGSPVTEIGPRWGRTPSKSPSLTPSLSPHDPLAKADKKATGRKEVGRSRSRDRTPPRKLTSSDARQHVWPTSPASPPGLFLCCIANHMELPEIIGIVSPTEWNSGSNAMPSGSAHEFEEFARDCVRLAEQADTQELREKLLNLAREWMRAVIEEEDTVMSSQAAE
jgi:hypothetical protein